MTSFRGPKFIPIGPLFVSTGAPSNELSSQFLAKYAAWLQRWDFGDEPGRNISFNGKLVQSGSRINGPLLQQSVRKAGSDPLRAEEREAMTIARNVGGGDGELLNFGRRVGAPAPNIPPGAGGGGSTGGGGAAAGPALGGAPGSFTSGISSILSQLRRLPKQGQIPPETPVTFTPPPPPPPGEPFPGGPSFPGGGPPGAPPAPGAPAPPTPQPPGAPRPPAPPAAPRPPERPEPRERERRRLEE